MHFNSKVIRSFSFWRLLPCFANILFYSGIATIRWPEFFRIYSSTLPFMSVDFSSVSTKHKLFASFFILVSNLSWLVTKTILRIYQIRILHFPMGNPWCTRSAKVLSWLTTQTVYPLKSLNVLGSIWNYG